MCCMRNTAQSTIFRGASTKTEHLECSECQFEKIMSGAVFSCSCWDSGGKARDKVVACVMSPP